MQPTALPIILAQLCAAAVIMAVALAGVMVTGPARANNARANNGEIAGLCADAATQRERRAGIPRNLLRAIATVESGRWDEPSRASFAWPWTVTAKGKGRFLPTKAAAIRAVQTLQREGVTNIDVGCMQINLAYHPDAFATLEEAFDPARNVAYAATFLTKLRKSRRTWTQAVRFYHSSNPQRQRRYSRKVYAAQRAIRASSRHAAAPPARRIVQAARPAYAARASWPPRGYRAQRAMELAARARAFNGRRR
jgi:hypothetical protein